MSIQPRGRIHTPSLFPKPVQEEPSVSGRQILQRQSELVIRHHHGMETFRPASREQCIQIVQDIRCQHIATHPIPEHQGFATRDIIEQDKVIHHLSAAQMRSRKMR